jgi:predicted transcriptional regulator
MAEQGRKKGGGGKLSRSETVTVRLDPKLRYLAELAARKQRRTLSSFIEWALEDTLDRVVVVENGKITKSIAEEAAELWDIDDSDRFIRLALMHNDLLTHDEQVLWKLIRENGFLWKGHYNNNVWTWRLSLDTFIFERLRDHWVDFVKVANGEKTKDILPKRSSQKDITKTTNDDLIPDITDEEEVIL